MPLDRATDRFFLMLINYLQQCSINKIHYSISIKPLLLGMKNRGYKIVSFFQKVSDLLFAYAGRFYYSSGFFL